MSVLSEECLAAHQSATEQMKLLVEAAVLERAKNGLAKLALAAPPCNEVMEAVRDIRKALATIEQQENV